MKLFKKLAIVSLVLVVLLGGAGYAVGDYFVKYALVRPEGETVASATDENAPVNVENTEVEENKAILEANYQNWVRETEVSELSITSHDGLRLNATKYVVDETSHQWAILVHGYTANQQSMQTRAYAFGEAGYNVITPDNRAHGTSEGTYIGMGWLDRFDILQWIDEIIAIDPEAEIVLYGISMGGATVMMTAGEELSDHVVAIVEDCGYTTVQEMFANQIEFRFSLPAYPLLDVAHLVANTKVGYDIYEASALEQVKKSELPILFIHGDADNYVPVEMVYELYDAAPNEKELLIIEGAGHGESDYLNPNLYYDTVFTFLEQYITK